MAIAEHTDDDNSFCVHLETDGALLPEWRDVREQQVPSEKHYFVEVATGQKFEIVFSIPKTYNWNSEATCLCFIIIVDGVEVKIFCILKKTVQSSLRAVHLESIDKLSFGSPAMNPPDQAQTADGASVKVDLSMTFDPIIAKHPTNLITGAGAPSSYSISQTGEISVNFRECVHDEGDTYFWSDEFIAEEDLHRAYAGNATHRVSYADGKGARIESGTLTKKVACKSASRSRKWQKIQFSYRMEGFLSSERYVQELCACLSNASGHLHQSQTTTTRPAIQATTSEVPSATDLAELQKKRDNLKAEVQAKKNELVAKRIEHERRREFANIQSEIDDLQTELQGIDNELKGLEA